MKFKNINHRRAKIGVWLALLALLVFAFLYPVSTTLVRVSLIGTGTLLFLATLHLCWKWRLPRYGLLAIAVAAAVLVLLPDRKIDSQALRDHFVQSLRRYEGVPYVWGGKDERGIDCSGLIRRAMCRACMEQGLQTGNGTLIREGMWLWWHDAAANRLGEDYQGRTKLLVESKTLREVDLSRIQAGDFAVTQGGCHCLAYLGERNWIQADPRAERVTVQNLDSSEDAWFLSPARIMRWSLLE